MELLHDTGVRLGLVTNGEHWMLVDAPKGETTGYASWYANLWLEEPITLRAFRTLLGADRFFGVPEDETLEALLDKSADEPAGSHRPAWLSGPQGGRGADPVARPGRPGPRAGAAGRRARDELYEAALTVMMRLVFLFCAEERELLLLGDAALRQELRRLDAAGATAGHGRPVRRGDPRTPATTPGPGCSTTFRAVYGGVRARPAQAPGLRRQPVRPRPLPVPRRPQAGDDVGRTPRPRRCRSTTARCCTCSKRSRCCRSRCRAAAPPRPAAELPGARHRADRPRLRGPARPHRQACHRAGAGAGRAHGTRSRRSPWPNWSGSRPRARTTCSSSSRTRRAGRSRRSRRR